MDLSRIEIKSINSDQSFEQLTQCLDHLVKMYRTLLEVVRKEKDILILSQIESLSENNRSKEAMLVKIRSLENQRIRCSKEYAQFVGADTERPRLLEIATLVEPAKADKLRNLHSVLDLLTKRVSEINKDNEVLVQSALQVVQGAMTNIRDTVSTKNTYVQAGKMKSSSSGGHLVKKQV